MPENRQKLTIYGQPPETAADEQPTEASIQTMRVRQRLTYGERLLRNSAIACMLLFTILSLRNIDHPWAKAASNGVEKALTAKIDLNETLGQLHFVRELMPESALVFWNMNQPEDFQRPVSGRLIHAYSQEQPWYTFQTIQGENVRTMRKGTLIDVSQTYADDWVLEVAHSDGSKTVYAYVDRGDMPVGTELNAGDVLTHSGKQGYLYMEYQKEGEPCAVKGLNP